MLQYCQISEKYSDRGWEEWLTQKIISLKNSMKKASEAEIFTKQQNEYGSITTLLRNEVSFSF